MQKKCSFETDGYYKIKIVYETITHYNANGR